MLKKKNLNKIDILGRYINNHHFYLEIDDDDLLEKNYIFKN